MNIFILGCGFVGSKLASHFKNQGHLITVTTTTPSRVQMLEEIANHVVLIDSETRLDKLLHFQDIVLVCVAPKNKDEYEEVYLKTAQKLEVALKNNTHVKQFLYTSSCSVYGDREGKWVDEDYPPMPLNLHQSVLLEAEKIYLTKLPSTIKTCVLRLGEIYGLERSMQERILKLSQSTYPGTGEHFTNLIHVEDIINAVDFCLSKKATGIFNLCNDSHISRKDFYDSWCKTLNISPLSFNSSLTSKFRGNKKVSNQKIKLMGFQFKHPLTEPTNNS